MPVGYLVAPTPPPGTGPPLTVGQVLDLAPAPALYSPGGEAELQRLFPEGVSPHGRQYLTTWQGPNWSWANEAFMEAVRRAEDSDKPSRMQSVFAWETVEAARLFAVTYRLGQPAGIWKVEAAVCHRANMSLMAATGGAVAHSFVLARAYWRGESGPAAEQWELPMVPPVTVLETVEELVR